MANERRTEYFTLKLELDDKTEYRDHKKNRYSGYIRSIRVGRASSPNAVFKIRLKEGDEISLWPGRIVNFTERSEGATFSWDSLPLEWAEIEISESSYFVSGDYQAGSSSSSSTGKSFRKNEYELNSTTPVQILSTNDKRVSVKIENNGQTPIFVGEQALIDNSIASALRRKNSIRIMPFSYEKINITGELWAIVDSTLRRDPLAAYSVDVTEILG